MRRPIAVSLMALGLLAGCTPDREPPEATYTRHPITASPDTVRARLRQTLTQQGFAVTEDAGGLVAQRKGTAEQPGITCPRVLVTDYNSEYVRSDWAAARALTTTLRIGLQPAAGGTELVITTEPHGTYLDRYTNFTFQKPCLSTGEIEQALAAAATAP